MTRFQLPQRVPPVVYFLGLAVLMVAVYLAASVAGGYLGFPLDDAWIFQTYARNLGERGEFAFTPGERSAGSTSPLWSVLLAAGYALRVDHRVWTYGLGALLLGLTAWLVYDRVSQWWPGRPWAAWAAGVLTVLEWHLVWAAASGMETLLYAALVLAAFSLSPARRPGWMGACAGLAVLARPEGLLLLPFLTALAWLSSGRPMRATVRLFAGFAAVWVPYLGFNIWLAGTPWPNTLYAKQAEYAALLSNPLLRRLVTVGLQPLVGPQALLVPGVLVAGWHAARARCWPILACLGWAGAVLAAYALRLPVTYQHGRYLIPTIPVILALGCGGMVHVLHLRSSRALWRIVSRAWVTAAGMLVLAFVGLGLRAYQRDVQIIESEMVAAAHWIRANTEPSARIAAHDIGALGYFAERQILDLAGLVSPDVIPIIRDEARLEQWLNESDTNYLVTFPGWYPQLVGKLDHAKVFQTAAPYSPAAGGENMAVYRWPERSP